MAAYADAGDMITFFDARNIGDLLSDDGDRISVAAISDNLKMIQILNGATGRVKAAIRQGDRYTTQQITDLSGESLEYLKYLTCCVAFCMLWKRRPSKDDSTQQQDACQEAAEGLESLRTGQAVFEVTEIIEGSKPKIDTISRVAARDHHLIVDQARINRFYPPRRTYKNR